MEKSNTHFGFETIPLKEKPERVRTVFSSVAPSYDLMNDLMSFGLHRFWKRRFVEMINPSPQKKYLDMAGGTGDIAFAIDAASQEKAKRLALEAQTRAEITVCDLTQAMLQEGQHRHTKRIARHPQYAACIHWEEGDACALNFEDLSYDCYSISFGLRNIAQQQTALEEAYRVLKPGGIFLCLEFSQLVLPLFEKLYDSYSFKILPRMGNLVAKDENAYRYLAESIRMHPPQDTLAAMLCDAGFARVKYQNLSGGIVAIHQGIRL